MPGIVARRDFAGDLLQVGPSAAPAIAVAAGPAAVPPPAAGPMPVPPPDGAADGWIATTGVIDGGACAGFGPGDPPGLSGGALGALGWLR